MEETKIQKLFIALTFLSWRDVKVLHEGSGRIAIINSDDISIGYCPVFFRLEDLKSSYPNAAYKEIELPLIDFSNVMKGGKQ